MTQLHQLKPTYQKIARKRIGRGGKRGTTSGRGQKGQKSRAGRRIRPAVRELVLRLPKRRGFKNKPVSAKPFIINVSELDEVLKGLGKEKLMISAEFLKELGVLPKRYVGAVKILGGGEIKRKIAVGEGILVSKGARAKLEKA